MTLLEAIHTHHRITCGICRSNFDLDANSYTRFEAMRFLYQLGWAIVNGETLCPSCVEDWQRESKDDTEPADPLHR